MTQVYVFLTTGFEEIEALTSVDVLRRGDVSVVTVSLEADASVLGAHGVLVYADTLFDEIEPTSSDLLLLPGGTVRINEHDGLKQLIQKHSELSGKIAAICAAPMVLGGLGLLNHKKATCYPGFEEYLEGAQLQTECPVVVDGNIITAKGPALSLSFALTLLEILEGKATRDKVAQGLLCE